MDNKERVKESQTQVALEAALRWNEHRVERDERLKRLDKGGPVLADTPERVALFRERQKTAAVVAAPANFDDEGLVAERKIGPTLDWKYFPPSEDARRAGIPVARIVTVPKPGEVAEGYASGFLVGPAMLLTNYHVFQKEGDAVGAGANFLYERNPKNVLQQGMIFELDPVIFFYNNKALDFALVAVKSTSIKGELLEPLGVLPLDGTTGKALIGQPVNIIEYPNGEEKRYATEKNQLVGVLGEGFLQYITDTLQGSSGSPAFNERWEVIALHHTGVPKIVNGKILNRNGQPWDKTMGDDAIDWVANEGVRVSAIVNHLEQLRLSDPAKADRLRSVLQPRGISRNETLGNGTLKPEHRTEGGMNSAAVIFNIYGTTTINVTTQTTGGPERSTLAPMLSAAPTVAQLEEKKLLIDQRYNKRDGYNPNFLEGVEVAPPKVEAGRKQDLLLDAGEPLVLDYHHFSLVMNKARRLQVWSAVNVDYSEERRPFKGERKEFGDDSWTLDPRIAAQNQIVNEEIYKGTQFDRGHVVRRDDNAWGKSQEEQMFANADTFHYTNCTPQHKAFNQSRLKGIWGELENFIQKSIKAIGNKACIFAGPVLSEDDPTREFDFGPIQYPQKFWKVFIALEQEGNKNVLRAYGFILDQTDVIAQFGLEERLNIPDKFTAQQVTLEEITALTGVVFDKTILKAQVKPAPTEVGAPESMRIGLDSLEAVKLH